MSGLIEKIKDAVHGDKHHSSSNDPASAKGHDSHAANKADPRIDSDRDGRANPLSGNTAGHSTTTGHSTTGHSSGAGLSGYGSGTHTTGSNTLGSSTHTSSNTGPHDSNLANKADPRVDSDRDHRANPTSGGLGSNTGAYGSSHTGTHTGTHTGAHTGSHTTGATGLNNPGPAPNTAGPHSKDILNKVDPRVDSDRDGSKTVGQDQTYARS
jgi:hypothetical protein